MMIVHLWCESQLLANWFIPKISWHASNRTVQLAVGRLERVLEVACVGDC